MNRSVLLLILSILGACSSQPPEIKERTEAALSILKIEPESFKPVEIKSIPYLMGEKIKIDEPVPKMFEKRIELSVINKSLEVIADVISEYADIPIFVDVDNVSSSASNSPVTFSFSGKLEQALNKLTNRTGNYWKYEENKIIIFQFETKSFTLDWFGEATMQASHASQGQSGQNLSISFNNGTWDQLVSSLQTFLSSAGSINLNRANNQIIVRDRPPNLAKIEREIKRLNREFKRLVRLDVRVLSLRLNNTESFSSVLSNVLGKFGNVALTASAPSVVAAANPVSLRLSDPSAGDLLINALAENRDVSVLTSIKDVASINQPYPIKNLREVGYIESVSVNPNSSTTLDITPGTIEIGLNLIIIPSIVSEDKIGLQIALDLTDLVELQTFGSTIVQTPTINRRSIAKRVVVKTGETTFLSGLDSKRTSLTQNGVGQPELWAIGGGKNQIRARDIAVVMITAEIL